jgi:hypothetical protein
MDATYSLANSMLVIASAEFNMVLAVMEWICENTNRSTHLIPQERCLSMVGFKRVLFSWLPDKNILLGSREITKFD